MTVEKQSFVQPPGPRVPVPTAITNVIATLRGTSRSRDRIYVVTGHYDSRVHRRPRLHQRRARGRRRRLRGRGRAGAGPRDGDPPVRGDDHLRRLRRRGAGHLRLGVLGRAGKAAGANIQGMFSNDIIGAHARPTAARPTATVRLFARASPTTETPAAGRDPADDGRGERRAVAPARHASSRDVAEPARPAMNVWIIYRRDRFLRGSDHVPFLEQGYPAGPLHRAGRELPPRAPERPGRERRPVRRPDQFVDFDYIANVARMNAAALAALATGRPRRRASR